LKKLIQWLKNNIPQIIIICGFFMIAVGASQIYLPLGIITGGILLSILAFWQLN